MHLSINTITKLRIQNKQKNKNINTFKDLKKTQLSINYEEYELHFHILHIRIIAVIMFDVFKTHN